MPEPSERTRHKMQRIRSKDTRPEILLRRALWQRGLRYRVHYRLIPGNPDIVFTRVKLAVFCDGSFWHGQNWPQLRNRLNTNTSYWIPKIERTMRRDEKNSRELAEAGWEVIRLWDNQITNCLSDCVEKIASAWESRRLRNE